MTISYIPLDKEKHKDLKINLQHDFGYAKEAHIAAASIREYAQLASVMPVVFVKDPNSENFHSVTMLGTEKGSNLFVHEGKWQVHCLPMNIQPYPFDVRPDGEKLGVFFDENSALITDDGEPVFTAEGEPSPFLENRQQLLSELANSEMATQRFIKKLVELELLDPIELLVNYANGEKRNITGMFSVSEKRLQDLGEEQVVELHKSGFLGAAYAVLMSLGQLNRLVHLSNNTDKPIQNLQLRVGDAISKEQPAAEQPANS